MQKQASLCEFKTNLSFLSATATYWESARRRGGGRGKKAGEKQVQLYGNTLWNARNGQFYKNGQLPYLNLKLRRNLIREKERQKSSVGSGCG